jgi:excisionase family DNA binding protein
MSEPEKLAYRVSELVALTGLSKTTIYRLLASGELRSFRLHGVRLVLKSEFDTFLAKAIEKDAGLRGQLSVAASRSAPSIGDTLRPSPVSSTLAPRAAEQSAGVNDRAREELGE